ncbi:MAG: hypothetical protein N2379_10880, partial [Verrucomicrobiae bacterium]|nr:hypothetical protein [Verrucomicrobiae bacterium]
MKRQAQIRKELIFQLYHSGHVPLSLRNIAREARRADLDFTEPELLDGLHYLVSAGLAELLLDPVSGERRWRITA